MYEEVPMRSNVEIILKTRFKINDQCLIKFTCLSTLLHSEPYLLPNLRTYICSGIYTIDINRIVVEIVI